MSRKTKGKKNRVEPPEPQPARRGPPAWLPPVGGLVALAIVVALAAYVLRRDRPVPSTETPPHETPRTTVVPAEKPAEYDKLVGKWMRPDGGYVVEIRSVSPEGEIDAAYYNPRQITVSRADVSLKQGKMQLFIELKDWGYEGNYYTLTYEPEGDRLAGVYHQLTLGQNFEVEFVRMAPEGL